MELKVQGRKKWCARIEVPGDKSLSHRALMLGAIASGTSHVSHLLVSEDCMSTMRCMEALGVRYEQQGSPCRYAVHGRGPGSLVEPFDVLNAGNSGTTMRLISGILCGLPFFTCITGDSSLNRRPMKRVIVPLTLMGARIWARENNRYAPIAFQGAPLKGIEYTLPVSSAQVKSAILLAGLHAEGKVSVTEPEKTRDHTENMLRMMGVEVVTAGNVVSLSRPDRLHPFTLQVPGDISSAAFFMAASAGLQKGEVTLCSVGINPTRSGFLQIMKAMGARISVENVREVIPGEPCGDITIKESGLQGVVVEGSTVPQAIDELPLLAVLATRASGTTVVRNAEELRVKESDRIEAVVSELRKMGAQLEAQQDGFVVEGPSTLTGCRVKSYGDHRIAMGLAVAGLFAHGETVIEDAECVSISFPEFSSLLDSGERE